MGSKSITDQVLLLFENSNFFRETSDKYLQRRMLIKVAMLLQICTAVGSQVETIGDVITLSAYNYWVITLHTAKALDNK